MEVAFFQDWLEQRKIIAAHIVPEAEIHLILEGNMKLISANSMVFYHFITREKRKKDYFFFFSKPWFILPEENIWLMSKNLLWDEYSVRG